MLRIGLLMIFAFNAYCLEVIPLTTVSNDPSMALNLSSPIGIPAISQASTGKVAAKTINNALLDTTIFIIGVDKASQEWLQQHQKQLKDMQAIGFITNVDNFEVIAQLQEQSQLPLLPVNVDPLLKLINEQHYPLVISGGKVWQ
ncbi:PFL_4695 family integrating conjugative element protein [Legionella nagasakiensis]|uniref:PFL_4695 family integrating conjugative element protein n=1 Tax=Legionella nagasakiensis TaxID=535290 RepID=UPI001055D092|nr:integrating conjugative element protein [Legionella nagasakiensis]